MPSICGSFTILRNNHIVRFTVQTASGWPNEAPSQGKNETIQKTLMRMDCVSLLSFVCDATAHEQNYDPKSALHSNLISSLSDIIIKVCFYQHVLCEWRCCSEHYFIEGIPKGCGYEARFPLGHKLQKWSIDNSHRCRLLLRQCLLQPII